MVSVLTKERDKTAVVMIEIEKRLSTIVRNTSVKKPGDHDTI